MQYRHSISEVTGRFIRKARQRVFGGQFRRNLFGRAFFLSKQMASSFNSTYERWLRLRRSQASVCDGQQPTRLVAAHMELFREIRPMIEKDVRHTQIEKRLDRAVLPETGSNPLGIGLGAQGSSALPAGEDMRYFGRGTPRYCTLRNVNLMRN